MSGSGTLRRMTHNPPTGNCPHCDRPLPAYEPPARCPHCGLPPAAPVLDRLQWVDAELRRLDHQRGTLLAHRSRLLAELRAAAPPQWGPRPLPPRRAETSPRTARNVLLALGGVLLTVAALAFTLLSWGRMGIGGRAAVLGTVTLLATALPVLLLRRALKATAEAVASVGLVLLLLDAYALRQVSLPDTDALRYTASALAVVAVLWAAYGLLLPRPGLRVPVPAAVVLGQLPIPLWAAAAGAQTQGMAWALLATASLDVLLAVSPGGHRPPSGVRATAAVTALLTGIPALALAGLLSASAHDLPVAARAGALLLAAAAVLLCAGRRERTFALPLGGAAGLLLIAASGGLARTLVPSDAWIVPGYLLCAVGVGLSAVALRRLRTPAASDAGGTGKSGRLRIPKRSATAGLLQAVGAMHAVALLYAAPALLQALLVPLRWAATPWQGAPTGAADAGTLLGSGAPWFGDAGTPVLFAVPALLLMAVSRFPGLAAVRRQAAAVALLLGCAAAVVTPLALGLPYAGVTYALVALVVALLALSVAVPAGRPATGTAPSLTATVPLTATVAALVAAGTATGWALADRTTTLVVLSVLGAAFAAAAGMTVRAGDGTDSSTVADPDGAAGAHTAPTAPAGRSALCAAAAVSCAAGLARALPAALGVPSEQAAFAVLTVAAATALIAARLRAWALRTDRPRPADADTVAGSAAVSLAVECMGYAVAGWAVALSAASLPLLALTLGLCGVLAGGVALRGDRRPAGFAATALFLLATWVRLFASEVSVPEAYGLPLAVAALAVGLLRARRNPRLSSWASYGPALSCALLPSLVMVWGDPHWLRPLLLGAGALAVTLLGARLRLQALLLAGGTVLALVAGHELAPYVTQVIGLLPRWLPPALAGLLLLAVGATYEQRLRDARRLHAAWRRLG